MHVTVDDVNYFRGACLASTMKQLLKVGIEAEGNLSSLLPIFL